MAAGGFQSHELMQFEKQLMSLMSHFLLYENADNQRRALACVPLDDLISIAQAKYDSFPKSKEVEDIKAELVIRDLLLLELLEWFKNDFFTWMDSPDCPHCSTKTTQLGHGALTLEEITDSAGRVETYTCTSCFSDKREVARFPRYNDPVILLSKRRGRCGEWANCFALICRAVGFEVRHVTDQTDHVWVEIYSAGLKVNRWMHADPCENSCDSPLLYERGWGKKLSYVIAVSQDDIQDVTWRYTSKKCQKDVLTRRTICDEKWLVKTILRLRAAKQLHISAERKKILTQRLVYELVEFMSPKEDEKDSEKAVRESGSLAWRLARQELGSSEEVTVAENYVWEISESRLNGSTFRCQYDCGHDKYFVLKNGGEIETIDGWQKGVYKIDNLFRKQEQDWKMVYLARKEHSNKQTAMISWKFALPTGSSKQIQSTEVSIKSASFHSSASIAITIVTSLGHSVTLSEADFKDGTWMWNSDESLETKSKVTGSKHIIITCELGGGAGDQAWQHVQLFRQNLPSSTVETIPFQTPFSIILGIGDD